MYEHLRSLRHIKDLALLQVEDGASHWDIALFLLTLDHRRVNSAKSGFLALSGLETDNAVTISPTMLKISRNMLCCSDDEWLFL